MIVRELFARLGLDVDEDSFDKGDARIEALAGGMRSMLVGAAAAVGGLAVLVRQVAQVGAHANDTADRLGLSTDAVQELGYAAKLTDTAFESLQQGLAFMARKGVKDLDKGLADLADQVAALPPGGERAAAAMEALGRGGVDLVPLLAQGSEGIARLREQARSMGLVLEGDALRAADKFDDGLDRLGQRARGLRNRVIGPWMPTFLKWLDKVEAAFVAVSDAMAEVAKWADLLVVLFGSALAANLVLLVVQLAAAAGGFDILAASAARAAWDTIAAWVAAAAPFLAITAAIASVILIVEDLYTSLTGGEGVILPTLKRFGESLKDAFATAFEFWKTGFVEFFDWLGRKAVEVGDWIAGVVSAPFKAVRRLFIGQEPTPDGVPTVTPSGATAFSPASFFGPGASPRASAEATASRALLSMPRFDASFVVNAAPGQDPQAVAGAVRDAMDQWHSTKMRETYAAVGGG